MQFGQSWHFPESCMSEVSAECAGVQDERVLTELCEELLGPIRLPADSSGGWAESWERTILGLDKRALLKEVLKEVARHRTHPRLITQFTDLQQAAEEESHN